MLRNNNRYVKNMFFFLKNYFLKIIFFENGFFEIIQFLGVKVTEFSDQLPLNSYVLKVIDCYFGSF